MLKLNVDVFLTFTLSSILILVVNSSNVVESTFMLPLILRNCRYSRDSVDCGHSVQLLVCPFSVMYISGDLCVWIMFWCLQYYAVEFTYDTQLLRVSILLQNFTIFKLTHRMTTEEMRKNQHILSFLFLYRVHKFYNY
jgi:hypothetical protein